jgi:hypothetical protein
MNGAPSDSLIRRLSWGAAIVVAIREQMRFASAARERSHVISLQPATFPVQRHQVACNEISSIPALT